MPVQQGFVKVILVVSAGLIASYDHEPQVFESIHKRHQSLLPLSRGLFLLSIDNSVQRKAFGMCDLSDEIKVAGSPLEVWFSGVALSLVLVRIPSGTAPTPE